MLRPLLYLSLFLVLTACDSLPKSVQPPILDGVPTLSDVADSLNSAKANSIKWSVVDQQIIYAVSENVDWRKEFAIALKDDVNQLRFKDAFEITDDINSGDRHIRFSALKESQEVRQMDIVLRNARVLSYRLEKERNNLLSYSQMSFSYDQSTYSLALDQRMASLFDNTQEMHGEIVPNGAVWRGVFDLGESRLPINFVFNSESEEMYVKNGAELLLFKKIAGQGDSIVFESAYFNAYFSLQQTSDSTMEGDWVNAKRDQTRRLPFVANKGVGYRFKPSSLPSIDLSGEHMMVLEGPDGSLSDTCMLLLNQDHHIVRGSILTETGDYRWLDGVIRNDSLLLSTMDGTHAYLFQARIGENQLEGLFSAGKTWRQKWVANINKGYKLRDPESITTLQSDSSFHFSFPTADGNLVSLSDESFQNKVTLVSIMGTWCSNCLDETMFLKEIQSRYSSDDVAIVALDFELIKDSARAKENMLRYQNNLDIDFPILLASLGASKDEASQVLPMLNGIYSYPTLVVLDRNQEVVNIHTGFSGPATGDEHYKRFRAKYFALINRLVKN